MAEKRGFMKAVPQREFFKAGFYGRSGSGKTLTSLLVAEALAKREGKRVAMIDTERGSVLYRRTIAERTVHPEAFDIDILDTRSIYEALDAVENIDPNVHGVLLIDSISALWDAAKATYQGKLTSRGSIPVQAWGSIKKPYKRLMSLFLDGEYHALLCGREGLEMEEDEDGSTKVIGKKLRAENETQYEPHILVHMVPERTEQGAFVIQAFVEKDRSGILTGKTFPWPTYDTFSRVVDVLSGDAHSARLGTPEENSDRDAEAAERRRDQEEAERKALFESIRDAINAARDVDALKAAWSLTTGKKTKIGEDLMVALEAAKDARKVELLGKVA